jgi:hypothetical protein
MNYIVIDIEGVNWRYSPQLFTTLSEAKEYCETQNERYGSRCPFVVKKLTSI